MEYIRVDEHNIDKEHICCSLSGEESANKKQWMKQMFSYGYTFIKLNERAKVFVDFMPAEYAFAPLQAENCMYIGCLWVAGKYAKQGHATRLLALVEKEAKQHDKEGIVCIAHTQKKPYHNDAKFFMKSGFEVVDQSNDGYLLLYKSLKETDNKVAFLDNVNKPKTDDGLVLYYSNQCAFTKKYVELVEKCALDNNIALKIEEIKTYSQAQSLGLIRSMYALFYNHTLLTNDILTPAKFLKLMEKIGYE